MTDRLDLPVRFRRAVEALLAEHVPDTEVWAYGSRVKGRSHPASDLDLVLRSRTLEPIPAGRLSDLEEALEESNIPILIQTLDWASLPSSFHDEIKRQYLVFRAVPSDGEDCRDRWITVRLGDACTKIGSGATPRGGSKTYLQIGPYALIRSQNVHNDRFRHEGLAYIDNNQARKLSSVEVCAGDVLLNITGDSVARSCQVDPAILPARVNQHVAIIRTDRTVLSPSFLRYALIQPAMQEQLLSLAGSGGTRKALTKRDIESLSIAAPHSVRHQERISNILDVLDAKIELNRRMSKTLEEMAQALFKSWFVDFDPVKAKAEGRPSGLPPHLDTLFPNSFQSSELGPIPTGWRIENLCDSFTLVLGQSPPGYTYNEIGDGLPFFQGCADFGHRYPANRVYCNAPVRVVEPQGTLISIRAPVGEINMAYDRSCIGRGLASLLHRSGFGSYTYYAVKELQSQIRQYDDSGTVFGSISKQQLQEVRLIEAPTSLVEGFDSIVRMFDDRLRISVRETTHLAATRNTLLSDLLSNQFFKTG